MKKTFLIICLCLLLSCEKDPMSTSNTNNPAIKVEFLFEVEGSKVWRFYDNGYAHYVVTGKTAIQTETAFRSGKTTIYDLTKTIQY